MEREAGAGQHDRHDAGGAQRGDLFEGGVHEVVGRDAAQLGGQQAAARAGELVGVDLEAVAQALPRLQHAPRLGHREGAFVAEHVDEVGLAAQRRQHLVAHEVDELVVAPAELGRREVRAEEGEAAAGRMTRRRRRQHLRFVLGGEAVTALDLEAGRAVGEERVEALAGGRGELVEARRARRRHGRVDAAARGQDGGVAHAAQAGRVLVGARAGEHGVGVGVDEAGQHAGAGRVELDGVRRAARRPRRAAPRGPPRRCARRAPRGRRRAARRDRRRRPRGPHRRP